MADFTDNNNVAQSARVTGNRNVVTLPAMWKWLAQGKIFEAGLGPEDTPVDSEAALADITATFSLQSPSAAKPLVIPLFVKFMMIADGGALSNFQLAFTKPAALCATALTLSGTALTSKHSLYRTNPKQTEQTAEALSTVTVSVLVAADYISYHFSHLIDSVLTSGLVALGSGPSNVHDLRFLQDGLPHIMTAGAAMLMNCYTGTSDSTWFPYIQWAELELADLL